MAAQTAPKNSGTLLENAILSNPLTVFTSTELANLNQIPKFDVLLTDYGTGKDVTENSDTVLNSACSCI